ncbi:MAG: preprotein translocase subunit SecG [Oscillospiraceae bacterium]|nr:MULTISPECIES: preprotein translocase subunit SecG [Eubacteriales]MBS5134013.1 preprotein translocase subunit SecG [Oscillospiraceae bacterium]
MGARVKPINKKIAPTQGRKERCNVVKIILSVVLVLIALALIMVVMLQSGKSAGLSGTIAGVADTFMSKNKAKGWDAKLARWTKWVAIAFMVLLVVISLI